jgi:hypothetical protein
LKNWVLTETFAIGSHFLIQIFGDAMLKEQILNLATSAIVRAFEAQEKIKTKLSKSVAASYLTRLKKVAINAAMAGMSDDEKNNLNPLQHVRNDAKTSYKKNRKITSLKPHKKERKSSIKPAKEIKSDKADSILRTLKNEPHALLAAEDLNNKKSLACLVWALGHAERASLSQGISIHDVSALLYKAHNINLYPINISRVVHCNELLVRQAGKENRTKTYLLTDEGMKLFCDKFVKV